MADLNERDAKLVQYLSEAYGKERELETALEAHIAMTTKAPYKKRLKQHLQRDQSPRQTAAAPDQAAGWRRQTAQTRGRQGDGGGEGPAAHAVRGSGEQEKMLKNAKTEYFNEHEEIATYLAIETLADKVGDRETAKLAQATSAARRNGWRNSSRARSSR